MVTSTTPPATGAWQNSHRVAEFVANVISGVVVIGIIGTYAVHWLVHSIAEAPSLRALVSQRIEAVIEAVAWAPSGWRPCWTGREHTIAGAMLECVAGLVRHRYGVDELTSPEMLSRSAVVLVFLSTVTFVVTKYHSIGWYAWIQLVVLLQWCIALYQMVRVALSVSGYVLVKAIKHIVLLANRAYVNVFGIKRKHAEALRQLMKQAKSYAEWRKMAEYLDELEDKEHWKTLISRDEYELCDFAQLERTIQLLSTALAQENVEAIKYMLTSIVMRNKCGVDAPDLHLTCNTGTKHVIEHHHKLLTRAIVFLASADESRFSSDDKIDFFKKLKHAYGATALCLSGGGSIAMYHMGVIVALLDADMMPNVISGSSGGSIVAALVACNSNQALLDTVLVNDIAVRFIADEIQWFPPLMQQLERCIKTGFLVESSDFERTSMHYFGEPLESLEKTMHYTFQDAFLKTGRHVCITVSASDVTGHKGPKKLLLNHINTPHVLLWSAVAVSCSLPGIMKGKKLMARDHEGQVVPYDATGNEWVDGSIQHDLPMETMASCFNVTNFIVSQVNPHVVPFMGDDVHQPVFRKSLFHTLESVIAADVRHRLKMLAFLGLFPKIYGHQFSSYFEQNFSGNVTLIPDFIFLEAIGVKAILNPTRDDMDRYLIGGQRAVWPKLAFIGHLCAIEKCLDRCLSADAWSSVAASALASASGLSLSAPSMVKARAMRYENWLHPTSSERAAQASEALRQSDANGYTSKKR